MRKIVVAIALSMSSGAAMASSIEVIHPGRTSNGSIIAISCDACKPAKTPALTVSAAPATLPKGTQIVSIRDIDGRQETVRTEAWLGGSPVTFVSTNPVWLPLEPAQPAADAPTPAVDQATKTAALMPPADEGLATTPNEDTTLFTVTTAPLRPSH